MDRSEASRDRINGSEIVWTVRAPRNKTRIQFQLTEESPLFFYSTSWFLIFSDFFTPTKVQLPLDFSGRSRKKKTSRSSWCQNFCHAIVGNKRNLKEI
jgi:hypothetical protein